MKGEILNRYTVGAITTGCRRLAEEHAERGGHEIQLHQWPRPDWYKTPACDCGCLSKSESNKETPDLRGFLSNFAPNVESELNKQLALF